MYNQSDSLISKHKITVVGLTCNQSYSVPSNFYSCAVLYKKN